MSDSPAARRIGKYEVTGTIGRGAMGVVYEARDPALGRTVAIKTMALMGGESEGSDEELRTRFVREARSAGQLQHPNIITVHELIEDGQDAFLVMELLEGASLSALMKNGKHLSLGQKISILEQVGRGLQAAHEHGIVHRDVKPSNIFVTRAGVAKVLDFGVAKFGDGELTQAGTVFGTIEYMSPEQVRAQPVTPSADIFSLGIVAYELFSGTNPFRADSIAASVFKIISDTPDKLSAIVPELSRDVDDWVAKTMAKDLATRFDSLEDAINKLETLATHLKIDVRLPALAEKDVETARALSSLATPVKHAQISQWSHVSAAAHNLESTYQDGVELFHQQRFEECVLKMSEVLDHVPVHAMSLHYLALSEENMRQSRLDSAGKASLARVLHDMREAHRKGNSTRVIDLANRLLAIDRESMEARWYRRSAEARLRPANALRSNRSEGSMASYPARLGAQAPAEGPHEPGSLGTLGSFGYTPRSETSPSPRGTPPPIVMPAPSRELDSTSSTAIWVAGATALILAAVALVWLFGGTEVQTSATTSDPQMHEGVRTSMFDELDAPSVQIDVGLPPAHTTPDSLSETNARLDPERIQAGNSARLKLFGGEFSQSSEVSTSDGLFLFSWKLLSDSEIEATVVAADPGVYELSVVTDGKTLHQYTVEAVKAP